MLHKSKTLQDLLKVLSGNIVAQGIGFFTIVLISRDLGAIEYGIFSLLLAIFTVSVQISDFGISTSYVKYVSENRTKSKEIFYTIMMSKVWLSFIIMISLYFFSGYISQFFFNSVLYEEVIFFMSMAITFHAVYGVILADYQAKQEFKYLAYMTIAHNLLKIISILLIAVYTVKEVHLLYFTYSYFFILIVILFFLCIKNYKNILGSKSFAFIHLIKIYRLGFWIFLSSLATLIIMRLDIMMLQKMSSSEEVGYYSVAMSLAMIFPLITASLTTTLLPKMEQFLKENTVQSYIQKVLSKFKWVLLIFVVLELSSPLLIYLFFGESYSSSIEIFQILIVAFLFGVLINPISLIFYSINKASLLTLLNWIQLPLNYFGNLLLIPLYSADGAAISTVLLRVLGGVYILVYLLKVNHDR